MSTNARTRLLSWFYSFVQLAMLATSIPKVAALFAAYDPNGRGEAFGLGPVTVWTGDVMHYGMGLAIDLVVAFTGWAALNKFQATRQSRSLVPHALLIGACAMLSVVANYEDSAMLRPTQYLGVGFHLFSWTLPALTLNPFLVSSPPLIILLLVFLVPSILAEPRVKTPEELEREALSREAQIRAQARIKAAQADANARVRAAQVQGMAATGKAAQEALGVNVQLPKFLRRKDVDAPHSGDDDDDPHGGGVPRQSADGSAHSSADRTADGMRGLSLVPPTPDRAALNAFSALPLHKRVAQSGVLTTPDLAEALNLGVTQARNILQRVDGAVRSGASNTAAWQAPTECVVTYLTTHRSAQMREHGKALQQALRAPRRPRSSAHSVAQSGADSGRGRVLNLPTVERAAPTRSSVDDAQRLAYSGQHSPA